MKIKQKIYFNDYFDYYRYFSFLIDKERNESIKKVWDEIKKTNPEDREKSGRAILNLKAKEIKRTIGGRYEVSFYKDYILENEINVGDLVILSEDPSKFFYEGVCSYKDKTKIKVILDKKPPENFLNKNLRVDLFCNDITFERAKKALSLLFFKREICKILLGKGKPEFRNENIEIKNNYLNSSQKEVVKKTILAKNFFLIQGPPGTGKTTTIAGSIYEHVKRGYKVLATADSNIAVDNLVEALLRYDIKVVRIGHPAKVLKSILNNTLDFILEKTSEFNEIKIIWQEIERLKDINKSLNIDHKNLKNIETFIKNKKEIKKLKKLVRKLEKRAIRKIIKRADVVCTTNSGAGSDILNEFYFDVVFIDEANQSQEPVTLIPLTKGRKFIMAGDQNQLPPTVVCEKISPFLSLSLFERLIKIYGEKILGFLNIQYRMPDDILNFSNENFYNSKIISAKEAKKRNLKNILEEEKIEILKNLDDEINFILNPQKTICFIDIDSKEEKFQNATSYFNFKEINIIKEIVENIKKLGIENKSIGIISPYKDQVKILKETIKDDIEIKTIDGFQGREKDIIIISFTRANDKNIIGFLDDFRRLNVALTRAKRKLIVIGNSKTLKSNSLYKKLLDYFKEKNSYIYLGR
jgi:superfamily I DNA and/or RNA helicase